MEISIFGYKINLEILILIGVIYLIMVGHTIGGCCNFHGIMEGLEDMTTDPATGKKKVPSSSDVAAAVASVISPATHSVKEGMTPVFAHTTVTPAKKKKAATKAAFSNREGFVGANTNYGNSSPYSLGNYNSVDTSAWSMPNLTVMPGQPLDAGVQSILNRPKQQLPLPEDEMLLFANTPFKPECCPNTYSNSMGCACMTTGQFNYLQTRSGNNTPYSEY